MRRGGGRREDPERLARVARAEKALARVAAVERSAAEAAHQASIADGEAIIAALSGDSPWHGLLVPTVAGALRRNARLTDELAATAEAAAAAHVRAETRARIVMERVGSAERQAARDAERRRLEALGVATKDPAVGAVGKPLASFEL